MFDLLFSCPLALSNPESQIRRDVDRRGRGVEDVESRDRKKGFFLGLGERERVKSARRVSL